MHTYSASNQTSVENLDLLDEDFDSFTVRNPFSRKPIREQATLLCDGRGWDDAFDTSDMMCELA